jgi:hypothetical protein
MCKKFFHVQVITIIKCILAVNSTWTQWKLEVGSVCEERQLKCPSPAHLRLTLHCNAQADCNFSQWVKLEKMPKQLEFHNFSEKLFCGVCQVNLKVKYNEQKNPGRFTSKNTIGCTYCTALGNMLRLWPFCNWKSFTKSLYHCDCDWSANIVCSAARPHLNHQNFQFAQTVVV